MRDARDDRTASSAIELPEGAPVVRAAGASSYRAFEAPFKTPAGDPIRVFARSRAAPTTRTSRWASPSSSGLLINRHAQLGVVRPPRGRGEGAAARLQADDELAVRGPHHALRDLAPVPRRRHLLVVGLDVFPHRGRRTGKVTASEGLDCFVAVLQGMSRAARRTRSSTARIRRAQWHHAQAQRRRASCSSSARRTRWSSPASRRQPRRPRRLLRRLPRLPARRDRRGHRRPR